MSFSTNDGKSDRRKRRAVIMNGLYDQLERIVEDFAKPHTVYNFGGRDNVYNEQELPAMPPRELLAAMQAANHATDVIRKLHELEGGQTEDIEAANSMLGRLALSFGLIDSEGNETDLD